MSHCGAANIAGAHHEDTEGHASIVPVMCTLSQDASRTHRTHDNNVHPHQADKMWAFSDPQEGNNRIVGVAGGVLAIHVEGLI